MIGVIEILSSIAFARRKVKAVRMASARDLGDGMMG
jgi:hypothetical protein